MELLLTHKLKIFLLLFLSYVSLFAEVDFRVQNSNFTLMREYELLGKQQSYAYNYNRLRFLSDYSEGDFFASLIADGVNYYGGSFVGSEYFHLLQQQNADTPLTTQSGFYEYNEGAMYAKLYRAYGGYADALNRVSLGLQNITMGVGRIWTPTNLFNPRNTYAIEPDETFGSLALLYTRYISDTGQLSGVVSQREDESYKYALRYKAYLDFADLACNFIHSDTTTMLGYEIEGDLGDSGALFRSEGAYMEAKLQEDVVFFQGIIGMDYAFEDGFTLVTEALYSSQTFSPEEQLVNLQSELLPNLVGAPLQVGVSMSYIINLYFDASLLYIEDFGASEGRFVSPVLSYTLNDFNTLRVGALLGEREHTGYFEWSLSF